MADSHREEIAKLEALYAGNPGGRVFVHLAEAYRKAGEHERARRILDEGLGRHPDSASGYVVLGRVLADMQVSAEAEIAFRRVLELDGGNLVALRWLGDIARQSGRNADAAMHYRELLIRNPSNEEVRDLVEIVEREAAGDTTADGGLDGGTAPDAFAGLDEIQAGSDAAVAEPVSEAEEPGVMEPAAAGGDDAAGWSAAPGQTGDADEAPVEFGLVELDTIADDDQPGDAEAHGDRTGEEPEAAALPDESVWSASGAAETEESAWDTTSADADEPEWRAASPADTDQHETSGSTAEANDAADYAAAGSAYVDDEVSGLVASTDDDGDVLDVDELRRDDESEPLEIHLLDPAYEPSGDDEEYAGELDLTDIQPSSLLEEADDYADDSFVADLSAAAAEDPAEDALPGDTDVMDAPLTLLEGDGSDVGAAAGAAEAFAEQGAGGMPQDGDAAQEEDVEVEIYSGDVFAAGVSSSSSEVDTAEDSSGAADWQQNADAEEPEAAEGVQASDASPRTEDAGRTDYAALAGAAAPAAEAPPPSTREPESGLVTETMAVLYRSQGFHDRAADVYRALLRSRPHDERLAAKLRDAEEAARSTGQPAAAGAEDDAGEVWLRGVGAAWTGQEEGADDGATPYAWSSDDDEAETGEPIGSYLQDLVSWKAGSNAWIKPDTRSAEEPAGDIEMPDWLSGPGNSESWTPDSSQAESGTGKGAETEWASSDAAPAADAGWDPSDAGAAAPSGSSWEAPPEDEQADPWGQDTGSGGTDPWGGPPEQEERATAPEGESFDDAVPPDAMDGADTGAGTGAAPWDHQTSASETAPAAADESVGWTPFELDRDVPPAGPAPSEAAAEPAQPGLQDTPAEDEGSDDDDLEMFRSWLQSLKK